MNPLVFLLIAFESFYLSAVSQTKNSFQVKNSLHCTLLVLWTKMESQWEPGYWNKESLSLAVTREKTSHFHRGKGKLRGLWSTKDLWLFIGWVLARKEEESFFLQTGSATVTGCENLAICCKYEYSPIPFTQWSYLALLYSLFDSSACLNSWLSFYHLKEALPEFPITNKPGESSSSSPTHIAQSITTAFKHRNKVASLLGP